MPRRVPEKCKLLYGPYEPPALKRGDQATYLYRDALVVVTAWSDGRISWPRCRAIGRRGGSGLLVDEDLARAVRSESAAALRFWWGVAGSTVTLWRRAFGVEGWTGTEGTRRLVQSAADKGGAAVRGRPLTPEQVEQRRRNAHANNSAQSLDPARGRGWTETEMALLGVHPYGRVMSRTGRTKDAVRRKRRRLGIPNAEAPGWAEDELALLGKAPDAEVARQVGRTEKAVTQKRCELGILTFCDRRKGGGATGSPERPR